MNEQQQRKDQLSIEQEEALTRDLTLLLVAVSVLNRWTMQDIVDWYHISTHECLRKLVQLDRLKLIELLPDNRIRLRVSANFSCKVLRRSSFRPGLTVTPNVCWY